MNNTFNRYKKQGDIGEEMGYWFIKFYIQDANYLTQSDFIFNKNNLFEAKLAYKNKNKWYLVEIKHKDPYKYGDFIGTGLNEYQLKSRLEFYKDTGIDCLLVVFEKNGKNIYYQYLSELENHREYTKNGIVIYNYKYFNAIKKQDLFDKISNYIINQRQINKLIRSVSVDLFRILGIPNNDEYNIIKQNKINELKEQLLIKYKSL